MSVDPPKVRCPLAPPDEVMTSKAAEGATQAILEYRRRWSARLERWVTPALLFAILGFVFHAGQKLEEIRSEDRAAASERAHMRHDIDKSNDAIERFASTMAGTVKEIVAEVTALKVAVAGIEGQRDGWRNARDRREEER